MLNDRVVFTGYLSDTDLSLVLKHATVFAFPSLYEGFGLPVLEAMVAGVPVACSNVASLPEVVGEAAVLFDPTSSHAMMTAIARLLADPILRETLVGKGRANVAKFSWEQAAETTMAVYRTVGSPSIRSVNSKWRSSLLEAPASSVRG